MSKACGLTGTSWSSALRHYLRAIPKSINQSAALLASVGLTGDVQHRNHSCSNASDYPYNQDIVVPENRLTRSLPSFHPETAAKKVRAGETVGIPEIPDKRRLRTP